jgi:two-component system OmpR family sensor kinase
MHFVRKYWLELAWGAFALANIVLMFFLADWETIPFHNVWVSLALLYCVRRWSPRLTAVMLSGVILVAGISLAYVVAGPGDAGLDELAEVPMMSAMFLVIVWFAWRRNEALDELRRSSIRERDFIRDVSHYLRTPITIALGHAELIRANATDDQLVEDAEIVVDEMNRVSTISDRLLLLAMEDDLLHSVDEVDPGVLAAATCKRWSATADRDWEVSVGTTGTILADAERLILALDCLVENAVRATADGDTILIRTRSERGRAVLEVADSGEGIDADDQKRIFERFERGSRNDISNSGAGLGLALAKAIAEAHGGTLDVESVAGVGATFRMLLGVVHPANGTVALRLADGGALLEGVGAASRSHP